MAVFDCAATYQSVFPKDVLMQGHDHDNNFRHTSLLLQECIARTADIESMFHQVRVDSNHVHAL